MLEDLHGWSDDETEFQVLGSTSFRRFLGLSVSDKVLDARTLWLSKERLWAEGVRALFERSHQALSEQGLIGKEDQIIDATVVQASVQRNSRNENAQIKRGKRPDSFDARPSRGRQKDTDARWTKKHGRYCYGYENHAKADLTSKLVIDYQATHASVHDSQLPPDLVSPSDSAALGDAVYSGKPAAGVLATLGIRSFIHQKAAPGKLLSEAEKMLNRKKSRLRARVEHVFGWQSHRSAQNHWTAKGPAMHRAVQPNLQPLWHRANPPPVGNRLSDPSAVAHRTPSTAAETWVAGRFQLHKQI